MAGAGIRKAVVGEHKMHHRKWVSGRNYMVYCTCGLRLGATTMSDVRLIKQVHELTLGIITSGFARFKYPGEPVRS